MNSGGSHSGAQWKRTGYCGLAAAIQSLGLATEEALNIDFVVRNIITNGSTDKVD